MKFYLSKNIFIKITPQKEACESAKFVFDVNGSVAAIGLISRLPDLNILVDQTIGSAPWFSEESDFFRFDKGGKIQAIVLKIPQRNNSLPSNFQLVQPGYYSLQLDKITTDFVVPPRDFRHFDPIQRELYCFGNGSASENIFDFKLSANLSLFFCESGEFFGWRLRNPLECMVQSFDCDIENKEIDQYTYDIWKKFFEIFSDNQCDFFDDYMNLVIEKLEEEIPYENILKIENERIRNFLIGSINDLKIYFS